MSGQPAALRSRPARRPPPRSPRPGPADDVACLPPPSSGARAWIRGLRLRQWPKNLLVLGAPAAAGALWRTDVLARAPVAAVAFCLLSSAMYLVNDVRDADEDRRHPIKRHRPVAARAISPGTALIVAAELAAGGLAIAVALGPGSLALALAYVALNLAYNWRLRRIAIIDICAIGAAFVLRAMAGGVATSIPISRWFLVVVSAAALLVAAGKRYAEVTEPAARSARAALNDYNPEFLRMVITASLAVAVGAYCLWAFQGTAADTVGWREVTILPFAVALLRYLLLVSGGRGGAPEEILLGDRFTQISGGAWVLAFLLGLVQ